MRVKFCLRLFYVVFFAIANYVLVDLKFVNFKNKVLTKYCDHFKVV